MTSTESRPDPDALLHRLKSEEARSTRAKLHVFFGYAPGVGKTYRMLSNARELVVQGWDVLVGEVETHGRYDTGSLVLGLDLLAPREVLYRGVKLREFDLDAALARRPRVILLDELAHTNAPGGRHAKRWQDVMELLAAGVEVHTTLNVLHLESLNDVVEQITSVRVRETIPDQALDRADQIELVDITPDELLERLQEGKVYLRDQALRAKDHFFQRGNLLALRELALRRIAERVDADVLAYRQAHAIDRTWPAAERILVCVSPAPSSAKLVRAGQRMAAGLRVPWVAAYVERTSSPPLSESDQGRLERHLRLAQSLGATVVRLVGEKRSQAILAYAREHNVSRIILGKPTHSRLRDLVRGSLLVEVVRGSGDIEVHALPGDQASSRAAPGRAGPGPGDHGNRIPFYRPGAGYLRTALFIALATTFGWLGRGAVGLPDLAMLYLLVITVVALRFGRGPSIVAASLSVAAYDFFFVPPYLTFAVSDIRDVLTFATMFGVGVLISGLTLRIRRQEQYSLQRQARAAALYSLSRELTAATNDKQAAEAVASHSARVVRAGAAVHLVDATGDLRLAARVGTVPDGAEEQTVVKWVVEHAEPAGLGTDTLPGAQVLCLPFAAGGAVLGALRHDSGRIRRTAGEAGARAVGGVGGSCAQPGRGRARWSARYHQYSPGSSADFLRPGPDAAGPREPPGQRGHVHNFGFGDRDQGPASRWRLGTRDCGCGARDSGWHRRKGLREILPRSSRHIGRRRARPRDLSRDRGGTWRPDSSPAPGNGRNRLQPQAAHSRSPAIAGHYGGERAADTSDAAILLVEASTMVEAWTVTTNRKAELILLHLRLPERDGRSAPASC